MGVTDAMRLLRDQHESCFFENVDKLSDILERSIKMKILQQYYWLKTGDLASTPPYGGEGDQLVKRMNPFPKIVVINKLLEGVVKMEEDKLVGEEDQKGLLEEAYGDKRQEFFPPDIAWKLCHSARKELENYVGFNLFREFGDKSAMDNSYISNLKYIINMLVIVIKAEGEGDLKQLLVKRWYTLRHIYEIMAVDEGGWDLNLELKLLEKDLEIAELKSRYDLMLEELKNKNRNRKRERSDSTTSNGGGGKRKKKTRKRIKRKKRTRRK